LRYGLLGLLLFALPLGLWAQQNSGQPQKKLTIERLYTLPWLIGTRPESPVWSPDSQKVAFLWNDEGMNFRDVWLADRSTGIPTRVTAMPRPVNPADPGMDIAKLEQQAHAESDRGVSEVIWAPDGKQLIFTFHGQIYRVVPGQAPARLIDSETSQQSPAAAPSGNHIAYLSAGQLWIATVEDGKPSRKLIYAPGKDDVVVEEFHWSGDGQRLAFIESDARRVPTRGIPNYLGAETTLPRVTRPFPGEPSESRRLGVISAAGGPVTWAALGGSPLDQFFAISWSPDGKTILVDKSDLYIKDRRLLLVDPSSGQAKRLLQEVDPKNVTADWWSDWAPDGRGVYFISDRDNDYHVYYQPLAGGPPKPITAGNFAVFSASISSAGRALFVVTNQGKREERHLFRVPLGGGEPQRVTETPGTHTPVLSPDGRMVADVFSSDASPPDLFLIKAEGTASSVLQVTHSPLPEFKDYRWVTATYVDFPNINDGTMLHARLTLPPDFDPAGKYPAILGSVYSNTARNQWGGRIYHPTWGLDQYLAQQGYVILNVDISGSSGYGKSFRQRIGLDYGGVDVDDLYSGVRYLVGQGFVDEHRVGIWGSSYGGLLTTMSLFKRPGVYQAGVAGAPATSLFHAQTGEMRTMMAPQDHKKEYEDASAFLRSGGLQDHLMIIHGMKDDTVLFKDSVTLAQRLILQGKDVDLVVLPAAPHGWDNQGLAQTRFAYRKLVDYFQKYLGDSSGRN